jgi:hypothetical protein
LIIGALLTLGVGMYLFGVYTRTGIWPAPWVVPHGEVLDGQPVIGVPYSVSLYTHCGLRHVEFDGFNWAISGVLSDGSGNPPNTFGNPTDHGTVRLVTRVTALYRSELGEERTLTRGGGLPWVEGCL